jgi:hypothetical protein
VGELNLDSERRLSTEVKIDPFLVSAYLKMIVKMWKLAQLCGVAISPGCESIPLSRCIVRSPAYAMQASRITPPRSLTLMSRPVV